MTILATTCVLIPLVSAFVGWVFSMGENPNDYKAFKRVTDSH